MKTAFYLAIAFATLSACATSASKDPPIVCECYEIDCYCDDGLWRFPPDAECWVDSKCNYDNGHWQCVKYVR